MGAAVATAVSIGVADAGAASNTCATTGITTVVATKVLGAGSKCKAESAHSPGLVSDGEVVSPLAGVTIELFGKSYLKSYLQTSAYSAAYVRPLRLGGLGNSAGLFNSASYNYATLYFTAGAYTVLLGASSALAPSPASGVTKQEIEELAHAIYAHLG